MEGGTITPDGAFDVDPESSISRSAIEHSFHARVDGIQKGFVVHEEKNFVSDAVNN